MPRKRRNEGDPLAAEPCDVPTPDDLDRLSDVEIAAADDRGFDECRRLQWQVSAHRGDASRPTPLFLDEDGTKAAPSRLPEPAPLSAAQRRRVGAWLKWFDARGEPLPAALVELLVCVCDPDAGKRRSAHAQATTAEYRQAVNFEAAQPPDPFNVNPSMASGRGVAEHAFGARRTYGRKGSAAEACKKTVRDWRRKASYRAEVETTRDERYGADASQAKADNRRAMHHLASETLKTSRRGEAPASRTPDRK